jgi:hypothetical protein
MRTLTTAATAAVTAGNVPLLVFIEMDFASGFLRVNNSGQTFTWDGYEWFGVGSVGSIESIVEGSDLAATGIGFQLSGVDTTLVAVALDQKYQGRAVKLWYAPLSEGYSVVADPIGPFQYRMDTMDIELGQTANIRVTAESRLIDWERASNIRYTHEEQQRLHPGDLGLQFVPQMVEKQIRWGY